VRSRTRWRRDMIDRATYWIFEALGYALCELAFKTDCRGPFAWCYRAGCWCYGKAEEFVPL
jgi:hypothetical protein